MPTVNERCKILPSLNRVYVFEIVVLLVPRLKILRRRGLSYFGIFEKQEAQSSSQETNHNTMAHRLLRRMVEHLQERMACRETQLEARADDMRDPVTKRVEMALIRYNPKITEMEVRRRPDWRPRRSGGETGMEDREGDDQRDRLMARRRRRIRQI